MVFLTAAAEQQGGLLGLFMPFIIMLAVFYVFLIRPQQKQQKERQNMLNALKKGDKVVTIGGIHGEITALKDDVITLRVADKVEIRISRSGVGRVIK
ncbi:MAG: preprotein translocase subunit YajC [Firmicutes bacterium]|nr:preprotein translocase subunit YajC [Bacillota bacterium]